MTTLKAHFAQPLLLVASLILLMGVFATPSLAQSRTTSTRIATVTASPTSYDDVETSSLESETITVTPSNHYSPDRSVRDYYPEEGSSWYDPAGAPSGAVLQAATQQEILEALPLEFSDLEEVVASASFKVVAIGFGLVLLLTFLSLSLKNPSGIVKMLLFWSISGTVVLVTVFLAGSTLFVNFNSSSGGPVHWHADMEVWACGKELDLVNPTGLSNKIGTATLHEHNDKRIHLEGVVVKPHDASLGKYFHVIGGDITPNSLTFPSTEGVQRLVSGESCPDGSQAQLQVFVYKVEGTQYSQQKVVHPEAYVISPESAVPPGDCIIVEYGPAKDRTDKLCQQYKVADQIGKLQGEKR